MFTGNQSNSYDEIVTKATDENLTSENWELILNLCDKVLDEGSAGAHDVIVVLLKRLASRNSNVQLFALTLAESLSKNCGVELHREIASRSFTQALEKLITDRTTHDSVRRRALSLIATWTAEFENDSALGIMEECYNNLRAKNYTFEKSRESVSYAHDDDTRRKEEEELQRVLEMSMRDKGGRSNWQEYSTFGGASSSSAAASGSGSSSSFFGGSQSSSQLVKQTTPPAESSSSKTPSRSASLTRSQSESKTSQTANTTEQDPAVLSTQQVNPMFNRVRALFTFQPTDAGELAFEKGDIIKVVDRVYKDWWRGQLKGRTGIFPVNHVEPLPEPTGAEIAKEAEQEAAVFSQAATVDNLLNMLQSLDPTKDNLADNEEIQELYRNCMTLRPRIVKLIEKYSQKRTDLVSMNETFMRARAMFERMMEESLAIHTGVYDRFGSQPSGPQTFGWNPYDQPGYQGFSTSTSSPPYLQGSDAGVPQAHSPPIPYVDATAYQYPQSYAGAPSVQVAGSNLYAGQIPQHVPHMHDANSVPGLPTTHFQQSLPVQVQSGQLQGQLQGQGQPQPQVIQSQSQVQQSQPDQQLRGPQHTGLPLPFDPNSVYTDSNVQAWAKYYAQGGKDKAGAAYFISVPGVTDDAAPTVEQQQASQSPQQPAPPSQPPSMGVGDSSRSQGPLEAYEPYVGGQVPVIGAVTQTQSQPLEERHDAPAASVPRGGVTAPPSSMQLQQNPTAPLSTTFTNDHLAINGISSPQSMNAPPLISAPVQQAPLPYPAPVQTQGVSAPVTDSNSPPEYIHSQTLPPQLAAMSLNDNTLQNIQYSTL